MQNLSANRYKLTIHKYDYNLDKSQTAQRERTLNYPQIYDSTKYNHSWKLATSNSRNLCLRFCIPQHIGIHIFY